jgi:AraC-like DNA-binding protein
VSGTATGNATPSTCSTAVSPRRLLRRELAWTREDPQLGHLGSAAASSPAASTGRRSASASATWSGCASCAGAPVATHRGDLVGSLTLFLGALARALSPTLPSATHPVVLDAMRMMEERPAYPWTLTEIAHALHVAPGYLVRLFKAATGLPPMAYLSRQRIELAAARLLHTELFRATFPVALRAQRVHLPGAFHPRGPTVSDPVTAVLPEDPPTPIWYAPRAVTQPPREVS